MIGNIDVCSNGAIHGWHSSLSLIIEIDGVFAGNVRCTSPRPDVAAKGFASELCGFSFRLPDRFLDGKEHKVAIRPADQSDARPIERSLLFEAKRPAQKTTAVSTFSAGPRAAVISWDMAHNPAGRALVLVQVLQTFYPQVDLIGPLFPRFGHSVWRRSRG